MTPTILIVDDDPLIRELITTTLQDVAGFELQEAGDGLAAIAAAAATPPDIVFLDTTCRGSTASRPAGGCARIP